MLKNTEWNEFGFTNNEGVYIGFRDEWNTKNIEKLRDLFMNTAFEKNIIIYGLKRERGVGNTIQFDDMPLVSVERDHKFYPPEQNDTLYVGIDHGIRITWDPETMEELYKAIIEEAEARGIFIADYNNDEDDDWC